MKPGKLVRDLVPQRIISDGKTPLTALLNRVQYLQALRLKLVEEAHEVMSAETPDELLHELADVFEVIQTIMHEEKITRDALVRAQEEKRRTHGGFAARTFLFTKLK